MNVKELIASEFPSLTLQDTGERALHLMHEFHVLHLPLVQRDSYVALVSEEDILDWDTPEQPLSLAEFLQFRPAVNETAHPFDAVRLARQHQLSVIPVVNEHHDILQWWKKTLVDFLICLFLLDSIYAYQRQVFLANESFQRPVKLIFRKKK